MPLPVKVVGGGAVQAGVEQAVDPLFAAARVALRPWDYTNLGQNLGHYKLATSFSVVAAAGTGSLLTVRWAPLGNFYLVLTKFRIPQILLTTAFTTQQIVDMGLTFARGFNASDTGGGASLVPAANSAKARTSMGSSLITQILPATSAIVAGTRTLDTNPFAAMCADVATNTAATGGTPLVSNPKDLVIATQPGDHPPVLAANEGFILAALTSLGAVGVIKLYFQMEWAEVSLF